MILKFFSRFSFGTAIFYVGWFIYKRFTCISCWGNDLFFSVPFMALVPASLENFVIVKYFVVICNALLLWGVIYGVGEIIHCVVKKFKKR